MLRLPEPRPFIKPEKQRPQLANFLMLLMFAPYGVVMAGVALGGLAALAALAWNVLVD
ncbi:MAG: hypothetical protein K8I27_01280 [Planctomycetes bacterium]|nr:hypothetical protein [Planctomycetota bacterium]